MHVWLIELLSKAESIIRTKPILGMLIFTLLAAASAMLAFVSSAIIIPVGVYVWGEPPACCCCGLVGSRRRLRVYHQPLPRPARVNALSSGPALEQYEHRVSRQAPFGLVLLFQLALPSELPGYLLGIVRYPFWKYLGALALAELPYAVANIYLGNSFIERRIYPLIGMAAALAAFSGWALYTLHRRFSEKRS